MAKKAIRETSWTGKWFHLRILGSLAGKTRTAMPDIGESKLWKLPMYISSRDSGTMQVYINFNRLTLNSPSWSFRLREAMRFMRFAGEDETYSKMMTGPYISVHALMMYIEIWLLLRWKIYYCPFAGPSQYYGRLRSGPLTCCRDYYHILIKSRHGVDLLDIENHCESRCLSVNNLLGILNVRVAVPRALGTFTKTFLSLARSKMAFIF